MTSKDIELKPPKEGLSDVAYALTKGAISAVPTIGGPAAELFALVIAPPLERRRNIWMNAIAERLMNLEKAVKGFEVRHLVNNPLFITAIMQATVLALKNHQKEKLAALQNAVVNTALGIDIEENLQLLFLDFIDSFTPLHLKVLSYFHNPDKWLKEHGLTLGNLTMGPASTGLETGVPELRDQRSIYDVIVQDLFNRGLLNLDKNTVHVGMSLNDILESHTTEFGRKFLQYIGER